MLLRRDFAQLALWAQRGNYMRILASLLYDEDELIRWRAIEAIGRASALEAGRDMEKVRQIIRRQLWMMNDESGALSWHGPEVIAEILVNVPGLIDEYGKILMSFINEEPFERGVRWAISRLAPLRPEIFASSVDELIHSLKSKDAAIRGYSLMALKSLGAKIPPENLAILKNDDSSVGIYDFAGGELRNISISDLLTL